MTKKVDETLLWIQKVGNRIGLLLQKGKKDEARFIIFRIIKLMARKGYPAQQLMPIWENYIRGYGEPSNWEICQIIRLCQPLRMIAWKFLTTQPRCAYPYDLKYVIKYVPSLRRQAQRLLKQLTQIDEILTGIDIGGPRAQNEEEAKRMFYQTSQSDLSDRDLGKLAKQALSLEKKYNKDVRRLLAKLPEYVPGALEMVENFELKCLNATWEVLQMSHTDEEASQRAAAALKREYQAVKKVLNQMLRSN